MSPHLRSNITFYTSLLQRCRRLFLFVEDIGMYNHIAYHRKQKRLSQRDLAKLLNLPQQRISEWENNHRAPHLETALRIALILECRVDDLFTLQQTSPTRI